MPESYVVVPWGEDESGPPAVPPELSQLAQQVTSRYDMKVTDMRVMHTKADKGGAIWRMETDRGTRSLKLLHRSPNRSLFSIGAQDYLVRKGARVPALVKNKKGEPYCIAGGKAWIVSDWITPLTPAPKTKIEGAQALCFGLGEFHRHSRGYVPPAGAVYSSRLHRYPKLYQKMISKMGWFRRIAELYAERPAAPRIGSLIGKYEQQARDALYALENSAYSKLAARGPEAWGLAHQDYGWSNGQMGPGGVWIIDLDGVSFDLPIRDLRKLIASKCSDRGVWDPVWMKGMIDAYQEAYRIEPELYQVLLIDMALPNEFYRQACEMLLQPEKWLNKNTDLLIERLDASDASKWAALKEFGIRGWKPGAGSKKNQAAGIAPAIFRGSSPDSDVRPVLLPVEADASMKPVPAQGDGQSHADRRSSGSKARPTDTKLKAGKKTRQTDNAARSERAKAAGEGRHRATQKAAARPPADMLLQRWSKPTVTFETLFVGSEGRKSGLWTAKQSVPGKGAKGKERRKKRA